MRIRVCPVQNQQMAEKEKEKEKEKKTAW